MDCYIIRVYRQTEQGEIAGLLEHVGKQDGGRPFTSYDGLVKTMRNDLSAPADSKTAGGQTDANLRIVHSAKR